MKNLVLFSIWLLVASTSYAQTVMGPPDEEEKINPMKRLSMLTTNDLGESYDPATGTLSLAYTDISLPGNSSLKVEVRRKLTNTNDHFVGLKEMGNWSLDLPYVRGVFLSNKNNSSSYISIYPSRGWSFGKECEGDVSEVGGRSWDSSGRYWTVSPSNYWTGKFLNIPHEVSENLVWGRGAYEGKQITKSNHLVTSCFSRADGQGQGIVVTGPDGVRYTFDYVIEAKNGLPLPIGNDGYVRWLMATKVEDKFGNTVNYNYLDGRLRSIVASDGRTITLNYTNGFLSSVEANGRVWSYTYTGSSSASQKLNEVILPDNRRWKLGNLPFLQFAKAKRQQLLSETPGHCVVTPVTAAEEIIETPEQLKIGYTFAVVYHGIHNVKAYPYGPSSNWLAFNNVHCGAHWSLVKKTVSGPGIPSQVWNYVYSQNGGNYYEGAGDGNQYNVGQAQNKRLSENWSKPVALSFPFSKPDSVKDALSVKTTTIIGPVSREVFYIDRTFDSLTQNMILAVDTADKTTGKLLKRVENYYELGPAIGDYCKLSFLPTLDYDNPYKCSIFNNLLNVNHRVNLANKKIILYDLNGVPTSYTTSFSNYDFYGFFGVKSEKNSYSSNLRFIKNTYLHDLINWHLGLPRSTSVSKDGISYSEVNRTDYVQKSVSGRYLNVNVPAKVYEHGTLWFWYKEYHDDGNLKKIEYPISSRWKEYLNYKRGTPQTIRLPNSQSQTAQEMYREVDNNGWVVSATDFKGNKTIYKYDSMGRLTKATPANQQWFPVVINFIEASDSDLGISGVYKGMLLQKISKGDYLTNIFYDALLRPAIVTEEDMSDVGTRKYLYYKYDIDNNLVFESYPVSMLGLDYKGTSYSYDALDRLIKTTKDSSGGQVGSTKTYLSNNRIESSDYRNYITTTSYMAYGEPAYDLPLTISSPESVETSIEYNIYNKPIWVSQGGVTQHNVYNAQQQLCKQVRPDIGNMAFSYNLNGDVEWSAHGDSVDGSNTLCDLTVDATDKISYAYDNHGKLGSLLYGDGAPSKIYTYDKNGNLERLDVGGLKHVFTYDDQDNLTAEAVSLDGQTREIQYLYSSEGHVSDMIYPTGHLVSLSPNALGQPTAAYNITSGSFYAKNVRYHASGVIKDFTYGNGLLYSLNQNQQLLPDVIEVKNNANALLVGFGYQYDNNFNVTSIADKHVAGYSTNFSYDGLGRLKTANGYWGSGNYNYDTLGNITNYTLGSFKLNYIYHPSAKKLNSVSGSKAYSFAYDERGNVTKNTSTGQAFNYNLANQMISVGPNTYVYDGYNRRVKKQSATGSEIFFYSQAGKLRHTQKANGSKINYIYLGNQLIAKDETNSASSVLTNVSMNDANFEAALTWKNTGAYPWARGQNGRTYNGAVPKSGPTFGSQGSNYYAYTNGYSSAAGNVAQLESNYFMARNLMVDFDYYMYGANMGYLYVDVFYKGNWTTVWSRQGQQQTSTTAPWKTEKLSLHDFSGVIKVRFRAVAISGSAGDIGVDSIKFSVTNQDPSPSIPAPGPVVQPPTVSISCNPCNATASIMNYKTISVPVTVAASCSGSCMVEWFYSGDSFFSTNGGGLTRTFTKFCSFPFNHVGQIWVTVTDAATGLKATSIKKPVSLYCN